MNDSKRSKNLKTKDKTSAGDFDIDLNEDDEAIEERRIAEQREKRKALLEKLSAKETENNILSNNNGLFF